MAAAAAAAGAGEAGADAAAAAGAPAAAAAACWIADRGLLAYEAANDISVLPPLPIFLRTKIAKGRLLDAGVFHPLLRSRAAISTPATA